MPKDSIDSHEMQYINVTPSRLEDQHKPGETNDDVTLTRLGKKPILKRNFGLMSMLSFSCTVMITWEAVLFLFAISFANGGWAGSFWGFILTWMGTLSVFATMGELSSMAPTAGGQYHWVSMLAPPSMQRFLSYIIGWLTVSGWQAVVASGGFICAGVIMGLAVEGRTDPSFVPQPYQVTLLLWAVIVFAVFFNTVISRALPSAESCIMILHVVAFFGILIPLVYAAPHGSAKDVFTTFLNEGMWPNNGLSFLVGLLGPVFAFGGADGAVHMSEEIKNATTAVPRAMVFSILLNGLMGVGMMLAVLFCLGDVEKVLESPTGHPFMAVFEQAVGVNGGALTMSALIGVLAILATISWVASASRMLWSFARDRGVPGWRYISKVQPSTSIPVISIAVTTVISILLSLINIGSAVAFNDVVSLSVVGLWSSYLVGNSLFLFRRVTGGIREPGTVSPVSNRPKYLEESEAPLLEWGPWRIPEPFGTINNIFGCCFTALVLFFCMWPPVNHPGAADMNYSVLMEGGIMILAVIYYFIWGKRSYKGPVVEV